MSDFKFDKKMNQAGQRGIETKRESPQTWLDGSWVEVNLEFQNPISDSPTRALRSGKR